MLWLILWFVQALTAGSIEGTLVEAATGRPLSGLVVELRPAGMTYRTDAAGRFVFPAVPAGLYTLAVEQGSFRAHVPFSLEAGQRIFDSIVRVSYAPGIFGTVLDSNGERLAAARVVAFQMVYTPSGRRLRALKAAFTDDFGDYRLFWLRPGEYYVAASYVETDRRSAVSGFRLSPNVARRDDQFSTMYFGGSFTPAESQRIRLRAGTDASGVNIYFRDGPRYTVQGLLRGPSGPVCARVALLPEGGIFNEDTDYARESCGSFAIPDVSPGAYVLLAQGVGIASDIVRVNVTTRDVFGVGVFLRKTLDIDGNIRGAGWRGKTGSTKVSLIRSGGEIEQKFEGAVNGDGSFIVPGVAPGEYDVLLEPVPEGVYIASIRMSSRDVLASRLRVDGFDRGRLEIVLTSAGGTLDGVVKDRNGRPSAGAQIVLVPVSLRNRADRYKLTTSDLKGLFRVTDIPPGGYIALAFEAVDPGVYLAFAYHPSLYTQYASKGVSVVAGDFRQQSIQLTAVPADETSGGLE